MNQIKYVLVLIAITAMPFNAFAQADEGHTAGQEAAGVIATPTSSVNIGDIGFNVGKAAVESITLDTLTIGWLAD